MSQDKIRDYLPCLFNWAVVLDEKCDGKPQVIPVVFSCGKNKEK
jgi:hypothetical protein